MLASVREYLTLPQERFRELIGLMQESSEADGLFARAAPLPRQGRPDGGIRPVERAAPYPFPRQPPHYPDVERTDVEFLRPAGAQITSQQEV